MSFGVGHAFGWSGFLLGLGGSGYGCDSGSGYGLLVCGVVCGVA